MTAQHTFDLDSGKGQWVLYAAGDASLPADWIRGYVEWSHREEFVVRVSGSVGDQLNIVSRWQLRAAGDARHIAAVQDVARKRLGNLQRHVRDAEQELSRRQAAVWSALESMDLASLARTLTNSDAPSDQPRD